MSKKRLYEIAKELGKESKEVVARAKELGLEVKSHSSSVEADVAEKIVASFKPAAPKAEAKSVAPKANEAKVESKPATPATPKEEKVVAARPQSRNFKAEREARAKEQAERRKQNKGNNRDQQQNGNRQKMRTVMVENQVKETATTAVLMTKLRNNKVKEIVVMIAVNKRIIVPTKLVHVLTLRLVQQL